MKKTEVAGLFALARIEALRFEALIDGYGYEPEDPRFYTTHPRCAWWFVKTHHGWVKIGWRKRVINIDWSDTHVRKILSTDDVTKGVTFIHAWSEEDALKYLKALAIEMNRPPEELEHERQSTAVSS